MHWFQQKLALLSLCCLISTLSFGALADNTTNYSKQRKIFLKAEYNATLSKSKAYRKQFKKLEGYPLRPYVELAYLKKHVTLKNQDKIHDFLTRFEGTPLAWPLRKKWLRYLAKRDKQALFISYFNPSSDISLLCHQLRYRLSAGESQPAIFSEVDKLWVAKKSLPKACDPLFKYWQKAGHRTNDKIWQRLVLAASKGDHSLIPYLRRISPQQDRYLADLWYKVRRSPQAVSRLKSFPKLNKAKEKQILLYGIKRLIWKDKELALRSWAKIQKQYDFTAGEKAGVAKKFAIRLAKAGHKKATQWLEQVPNDMLTNDIVQWRVTDHLRRGDFQGALAILQSLPEELASKEIWSYWLARALDETGAKADAAKQYKKVALERHYYGFLAATLIGQEPNLADNPLVFTELEMQAVANNKAIQRAMELRHFKRYSAARREWNYLERKLTKREKLAAAKWTNQQGWFDRAIFTLAQQGYYDDVDLRFPLAFKKAVSHHSSRNELEPSLTYAIARRESSFMPDAHSPAGALGLMQLLPSTAGFIAKKNIKRSKLFNADINVQYGTDYLKYLLGKLQGNEVMAAAAYNAGMTRVKRWRKREPRLPADIWIETIPFKETREYVKSVLAYRQIYSTLLGGQENKFKQLTKMQIGL